MSTPGWYPDPGGQRDRLRYWDGRAWGADTVADPRTTGPAPDGPPPPGGGRRVLPFVLAAAALVLVLVVVATVALTRDREPATTNPGPLPPFPSPTRTVDPGPTPSLPSSPPSPRPRPTQPGPTVGVRPAACSRGAPTQRQTYPADGRVHGGDLSFLPPVSYLPILDPGTFDWAYDVGGVELAVQPRWSSALVVGALATPDGFTEPRQAASLVMACTASSSSYRGLTGRRDLRAQAVQVGRYRGWSLRSELRVDSPDTTLPGDVVQVVVLDLEQPETLAVFWGCAPIGNTDLQARLDATVQALRAF